MSSSITYLGQSYFHQDFQDEADEPIRIVEMFCDAEPPAVVDALRREVSALLTSDDTEADLSRTWLDEANAYYDPRGDELTMREWLQKIADVVDRKPDASAPATETAAAPDPGPGIPFKGTTEA